MTLATAFTDWDTTGMGNYGIGMTADLTTTGKKRKKKQRRSARESRYKEP